MPCVLLLLAAVVDAGELVGVGMDKPAPLPMKHSGPDPLQQPHSGPTQDSAYMSSSAASSAPASEWHSNGTSIAQPASNGFSSDSKKLSPRIFTFGIGPYCNHYFLKRLAGAYTAAVGHPQTTWRTTTRQLRCASPAGRCSAGAAGEVRRPVQASSGQQVPSCAAQVPALLTTCLGCADLLSTAVPGGVPVAVAAIGRGINDVAFRAHAIQATMEQMLHAAALPILSDVQLSVPGLTYMQLFPDPIPDVFVGQPLLVSGKFAGPWPEQIQMTGTLPSGEREYDRWGPGECWCRRCCDCAALFLHVSACSFRGYLQRQHQIKCRLYCLLCRCTCCSRWSWLLSRPANGLPPPAWLVCSAGLSLMQCTATR